MFDDKKMMDEVNRRADALADKISPVLAGHSMADGVMALMKMNCMIIGHVYGEQAAQELMEMLSEANAEIFGRYDPRFAGAAQAQRDPESGLADLVKVLPTAKWKSKAAKAGK